MNNPKLIIIIAVLISFLIGGLAGGFMGVIGDRYLAGYFYNEMPVV